MFLLVCLLNIGVGVNYFYCEDLYLYRLADSNLVMRQVHNVDINQTTTGFISTSFDIIKARICNDIIQKVEGVTWDRKKIILFANDSAANIRSELGISSNRPLIGVVGRLVSQKNHQRLLETMAIIK